MFKNIFNKGGSSTTSLFLAGWEVHFNGDKRCNDFIATQVTTEEIARSIEMAIELVFENDKLVKAYDLQKGLDKQERTLKPDEIGLSYPHVESNRIQQLRLDPNGIHQLGGEIPTGFRLPENDCAVPFQYLGFISNEDRNFSWLPFKLHLTAPIYLNFDKVFLDYSESSNIVLLNREEVEAADTSYEDDLNKGTEIIFEEKKFDFVNGSEFGGTGHAGIPAWIQYPDIPSCPRSGKRMKFLCQINGGIKAKRTNVTPKEESYRRYYESLNFWIDGDLFVFFEPTSKIACYFIQNT
jgi:hypothetical protein